MAGLLSILALVASLSGPETTRVGSLRATLPKLDCAVSVISPDGRQLAIVAPPSRILVLDVKSGHVDAEFSDVGSPVAVAWSSGSLSLGVLDDKAQVTVFDVAHARVTQRWRALPKLSGDWYDLRALTHVPGSHRWLVGFGSLVEVADGETGSAIAQIEAAESSLLSSMALSRDGALVAIGDAVGRVSVWSAATGRLKYGPVVSPKGESGAWVEGLDFHPDGTSVAIGGGDATARVWDFATGALREFPHTGMQFFDAMATRHVVFSDDGRLLATTSGDWWTTCVWDVRSGERLWMRDNQGGNGRKMEAGFSLDSRFVLTGYDGAILDSVRGDVAHRLAPLSEGTPRFKSGRNLAWTTAGDRLRVWSMETGVVVLDRAMSD